MYSYSLQNVYFKVFSPESSAAIEHLVEHGLINNGVEARDTAKFIKFVRYWYDIVNNRNPVMALRSTLLDNLAKYNGW
jgi:hypothetical protein